MDEQRKTPRRRVLKAATIEFGGGAIEVGILMEAFGRGLVSEPYLSTVVLGAIGIAMMLIGGSAIRATRRCISAR